MLAYSVQVPAPQTDQHTVPSSRTGQASPNTCVGIAVIWLHPPLHTHHRSVRDDAVSEREGLLCVLVTEHRDRHVGCSGCGRETMGEWTGQVHSH